MKAFLTSFAASLFFGYTAFLFVERKMIAQLRVKYPDWCLMQDSAVCLICTVALLVAALL